MPPQTATKGLRDLAFKTVSSLTISVRGSPSLSENVWNLQRKAIGTPLAQDADAGGLNIYGREP